VAFSPNGKLLAISTSDGSAKLFDLATRREVASLRGHLLGVHSLAFSPDGRRLATGSSLKEAVKLWDLTTLQEVATLEGQGDNFHFTAFSPDGNTLVSVNLQGTAHLWRALSWAEIEAAEKRLVVP
jgi:WD40 repeat protein